MKNKKRLLQALPLVVALLCIGGYLVQQTTASGIYRAGKHLVKVQDPLHETLVENASTHFQKIYDLYLKEHGITPYLAVIPDKNYYLKTSRDMTRLEYEELFELIRAQNSNMTYIDLRETLDLEDYYRTDPHWKQECILDVAELLGETMGITVETEYEICKLDEGFSGAYAEKYPWETAPDQIQYLTSEVLEQCTVTIYGAKEPKQSEIYDQTKALSENPYDMFLSGAAAVITIDNPAGDPKRELVMFRDSFGSSLAPLLVSGYGKVTLVDTRYISSELVGEFVEFEDQDVLFLYSAQLLNHSKALK